MNDLNPSTQPQGATPPDDAQLMAYVDGALAPSAARAVADALAHDPGLAARAERLAGSRALTREALDAPEALAVPPALRAAVEAMVAAKAAAAREAAPASQTQSQTQSQSQSQFQTPPAPSTPVRAPDVPTAPAAAPQPVATRRRPAARPGWWQRLLEGWSNLALPATVAASVLFGVIGFQLGRTPAGDGLALAVGTPAPTALAAVLDRLPSGEEQAVDGGSVTLVASFRDAAGGLCRDFSLDITGASGPAARTEAVACRQSPGTWTLRYAAAVPPAGEGFAPASGASALESYLSSIGAGEPMDAAAEQAALAAQR